MSTRYVFLGPSLPADQALALVPGLTILPPVAIGDLLRLSVVPGDVVAIVDGFFRQVGSVRHKEILYLLDKGVHVLGASSMGALRGAELEPFGMVGIGEVFRMYRSGEIEADDEVALQHMPAEEGYRSVSEALVNIRHNLRTAQRDGLISESTRLGIIELARARPFPQRVYSQLLKLGREAGLPAGELDALQDFLKNRRVDIKREDALELFKYLARFEAPPTRPSRPPMYQTTHFHRLLQSRKGRQVDEELFITDKGVLSLFQACAPSYPAFHYRVTLRTLVALYAAELGLQAPPNAELLAGFQERHALATPEDLRRWLDERQLTTEGLAQLLRDENLARQAVARRTGTPAPDSLELAMLEPLVAEYLVHRGLLESPDALPEQLAHWVRPQERESLSPTQLIARAAARSFLVSPSLRWVEPPINELKRLGIFAQGSALLRRVLYFNRLFRERHPEIVLERLSAQGMGDWMSTRWGTPEDLYLGAVERGMGGRSEAIQQARLLYLFDRQHPGELQSALPNLG